MKRSIADEHYMEERTLAIALAMASTPEEQAKIDACRAGTPSILLP